MCECIDGSIIIANDGAAGPPQRVRLDSSNPSELLPDELRSVVAVSPVPHGYMLAYCHGIHGCVARTGHLGWMRDDFLWPADVATAGDTVFVPCGGCVVNDRELLGGQVARVDLHSGRVKGSFGRRQLMSPRSIAVSGDGSVYVSDDVSNILVDPPIKVRYTYYYLYPHTVTENRDYGWYQIKKPYYSNNTN